MINYNGSVMEYNKYKLRIILVGGYFDSGFHRDIYGIKDDFSFVKVGKRKKYNIYFLLFKVLFYGLIQSSMKIILFILKA